MGEVNRAFMVMYKTKKKRTIKKKTTLILVAAAYKRFQLVKTKVRLEWYNVDQSILPSKKYSL